MMTVPYKFKLWELHELKKLDIFTIEEKPVCQCFQVIYSYENSILSS